MDIIILALVGFWVFLVAVKGLLSVGAGQGDRPEKGKKSQYGIGHFIGCLFQGLNPVTGRAGSTLVWAYQKLKKPASRIFWSPNWIWSHWIERKWIINTCTVLFWVIVFAVALS